MDAKFLKMKTLNLMDWREEMMATLNANEPHSRKKVSPIAHFSRLNVDPFAGFVEFILSTSPWDLLCGFVCTHNCGLIGNLEMIPIGLICG
jgi:hypothetical protein